MMRNVGLLLIAMGFVGGALSSVLHKDFIVLGYFLPAVAVGVLGVVLTQIGGKLRAQDSTRIESNFRALDESLTNIVRNLEHLDDHKEEIDVYDLPQRIDDLFIEDITTFADAREAIAHVWGSKAYAEIMTPFAAAERYLNRVWSTAADGYIDEAHTFLTRSREHFAQTLHKLESLRSEENAQNRSPTPKPAA